MSAADVERPPGPGPRGLHSHGRCNRYVGEHVNQLRHGYGVYTYSNKFFRYEGHWENGLKHGHGKLSLGDGGYYEGSFVKGEIEGHGYRLWGLSGNTYTGQFHQGEPHGRGVLRTVSGSIYEGSFDQGRKEGSGILTDSNGEMYEGEFHDNKRHGEGIQTTSTGDRYDGDWVADKHHGHGMLRCTNGTIYDGQWKADVFHGEGSILHCSGVMYKGMWLNGRPEKMPVAMRLGDDLNGSKYLTVEQGKLFSITVVCVDEDGEVTGLENGRSIAVTAAFKKLSALPSGKSRESVRHFSRTSDASTHSSEVKVIDTPFGYQASAYELLQVPQSIPSLPSSRPLTSGEDGEGKGGLFSQSQVFLDNSDAAMGGEKKIVSRSEKLIRGVATGYGGDVEATTVACTTSSSQDSTATGISSGLSQKLQQLAAGRPLERLETKSMFVSNKAPEKQSKEEKFLASLVEPSYVVSREGVASFKDLFFPPPQPPDISHIISPRSSKQESVGIMKVSPKPPTTAKGDGQRTLTPKREKSVKMQDSNKGAVGTSPPQRRGATTGHGAQASSKTKVTEKERLLQGRRERFCHTGTYVLIISDVTQPPFLGSALPDFFIQVKVVTHNYKTQKQSSLVRTSSSVKNTPLK